MADNQQGQLTPAQKTDLAKESRDFHWRSLRARRLRDLTSEKYLLHVDGEGLSQWLDIFRGTRLRSAPDLMGVPRAQNNQLRPIVDNFVAHLTTQNYQFVVEAKPDRRSRESAVIDQAIVNADVRRQNWNALWAEAKYMSACAGFCPVHAMWRDEQGDPYEAVLAEQPMGEEGGQVPMQGPRPGSIDSFVGNPFDTVFNSGSRRNSVHRTTYGRVLPAELVRQAFGRDDIEGNDRLPSASTYQRVVQRWIMAGGFTHGTAALSLGWGHEEMVGLIYDETLPGVHPDHPQGKLTISALKGLAATQRIEARGGLGEPTFLWSGPLPAGVFSFVNVYSHHRFDDVHGKPYVGDIDDDQIEINQLESLYNEFVRRATRAPLASSGKVNVETAGPLGDTLLEVEPLLHGGNIEMQFLEQPARHMPFLQAKIERVLEGMYRKAGWQAASRGEMRGSGKAIIALQQADDSIFGPITQRTAEELEAYADLCWRIRKEFMDVGMVLDRVGDDLAHLATPYVDRTMMSETPPVFTLVSGFGTSTEAKAQQLLNMFGMVDAKGEQLIGAREVRKLWPDNSLFPMTDDPQETRERRPRIVNELIRQQAQQLIQQQQQQQFPGWQPSMSDPLTAQAGEYLAFVIDSMEPALQDDDLEANIEVMSLITQDPTESPLARRTAMALAQEIAERGAPVAANRTLALVRAIFNAAVDLELVDANPASQPDRFLRAEKPRELALSKAQLRKVLKAVGAEGPEARAFFWLCIATAQRAGAVAASCWTEFDADDALWTIPPEERRKFKGYARLVPLTPPALSALETLRAEVPTDSPYLFPSRAATTVPHWTNWSGVCDNS